MKLTVGMCCYDDFDGVWFTIQSIKMYHAECIDDINFVIVDGNPTGKHGQACEQLVSTLTNRHGNNGLYVKNISHPGTASRNYVFEYAKTPYVLCLDSHVLLQPGSLKRLIDYYENNPECDDLLQGPLIDDDGKLFATRMDPVWDFNMYGKWVCDPKQANATDPYEVEMMGLGCFSSRKQSWLGFNKNFRGFGGEEGYIHKKYKQSGNKTLILPWLQWKHRFPRPHGVPYRNEYTDRIKNYMIGWAELGLDTQEIVDYYSKPNKTPGQERAGISKKDLTNMKVQYKHVSRDNESNSIQTEQENERLRSRVVELEMKLMEMMLSGDLPDDNHEIVEVDLAREDIDEILTQPRKDPKIGKIESKFAARLVQTPVEETAPVPAPVQNSDN